MGVTLDRALWLGIRFVLVPLTFCVLVVFLVRGNVGLVVVAFAAILGCVAVERMFRPGARRDRPSSGATPGRRCGNCFGPMGEKRGEFCSDECSRAHRAAW